MPAFTTLPQTDKRYVKWQNALQNSHVRLSDNTVFSVLSDKSTHQVFTFISNNVRYVLKQFEKDSFTQLDRNGIYRLQKQLFQQGVAPEPICYNEEEGVWVERYIQHTRDTASSGRCFQLGKALAKIHALKIDESDVAILDLPAQWQRYLAYLNPNTRMRWQAEVEKATYCYHNGLDKQAKVLCHHDLSFDHVLDENKPMVVDWEYAAMGNAMFDIASAIAINNLAEVGEKDVCKGYADQSGEAYEKVYKCVLAMKICTKVTNGLWYEAKSALPL